MKILLIGPLPPPHGGVSVHVLGICKALNSLEIPCLVLDPGRSDSKFYFTKALARYASEGWTIHLHTNGHNWKSWRLAILCGLAARMRGGSPVLTLHSGMAPGYLRRGIWSRRIAAVACRLYRRIICVSPAIHEGVLSLGIKPTRTEVAPACLGAQAPNIALDSPLLSWIERRRPILSTALFFRPEYGFHSLVEALKMLRKTHPEIGCLVMGSGEQREEAVAEIRNASLEDHVLPLGDVDHDRCLAVISRSDVYLRPALADGDSISVREALALGVPVVASRVGSRPEGVFLFEPDDSGAMACQVERALRLPVGSPSETANCMGKLLDIYRHTRNVEDILCADSR